MNPYRRTPVCFFYVLYILCMSNFVYIPLNTTEEEMQSWIEEQVARVCYHNEQWLQEQDEEYTESYC